VIPTDNTNQNKAFTGANRCGFLAKATSPWVANDVDRSVQITRDRTSSLLTWEHYDKSWALIMSTLRKVTKHVSHKFEPTVKASFELFVRPHSLRPPTVAPFLGSHAHACCVVAGKVCPHHRRIDEGVARSRGAAIPRAREACG
jgi:hypothetical protein